MAVGWPNDGRNEQRSADLVGKGSEDLKKGAQTMRMKDKVALISGAASGIGAATARLFAREGAKAVVVADILDKEGEAVAAGINKAGGKAAYVHLDVTDEAAWKAAVDKTVADHGALDVLVNNAGISGSAEQDLYDTAAW